MSYKQLHLLQLMLSDSGCVCLLHVVQCWTATSAQDCHPHSAFALAWHTTVLPSVVTWTISPPA